MKKAGKNNNLCYRYGNVSCQVRPADGVSGFLHSSADGYFFRVYDKSGAFTDYQLLHDDLEVTIARGALASFYSNEAIAVLDHSPAVLGLTAVTTPDKEG